MEDYKGSNYFFTRTDTKSPFKIMFYAFVFIYIFQFPISLWLNINPETNIPVTFFKLFEAYVFVLLSVLVTFSFFYLGTRNSSKKVKLYFKKKKKKIKFKNVLFIFFLFFLWSFVMLKLKIGMTIYADFDPLPFKLVGVFFYGRLIIQPLILSYISHSYVGTSKNNIIFLLIFLLGSYVAFTSGSRFASAMFALPVLLIYKAKSRFIFFAITIFIFIIISTLARHFYLPFQIGGAYIEIYANEVYQAFITEDLIFLPFKYFIFRIMGISELVLTLNFQSTNIFQGIYSLFTYFTPFVEDPNLVSSKTVFGKSDEFGGIGLDTFSNYWLFFGRNLVSYVLGLSIISFIFAKIYIYSSIIFQKLNFKEGELVFFILLFLLFIEGRSHLFPLLFIISWFFSKLNIKINKI